MWPAPTRPQALATTLFIAVRLLGQGPPFALLAPCLFPTVALATLYYTTVSGSPTRVSAMSAETLEVLSAVVCPAPMMTLGPQGGINRY